MVRDRLFGTGKRYLAFRPSKKSMKRVREKIHGITHARNGLLTVEKVVERLNKLTKGWGTFYSVGNPFKAFHAVNGYALRRMARFLNRIAGGNGPAAEKTRQILETKLGSEPLNPEAKPSGTSCVMREIDDPPPDANGKFGAIMDDLWSGCVSSSACCASRSSTF